MRKRRADEEAPGSPLSKRFALDELENVDDLYLQEYESFTTPVSPNSPNEGHSTPLTVITTPRTRFPSDLKTLPCTWPGCPKTFNRPARLRDHLNSHANHRPYKCPHENCDKDYIEDKHLKQHIKSVHDRERRHVCPVSGCGKSFVTGTRLRRHQAVHEGAERFRCEDCGQSFRKRDTLAKHVRKDHHNLRPYACAEQGCDSAFDTRASLKRHHEREHGEPRFWCAECGLQTLRGHNDDENRNGERSGAASRYRVGFNTEALLHSHMRKEHQNCLFCDFKSASAWELNQHIELNHSGKSLTERKTVSCPHRGCGRKFTRNSNLNSHIRTAHEGQRFICGQAEAVPNYRSSKGAALEGWSNEMGCGATFSTKARLGDHIRFVHLKHERPSYIRRSYGVSSKVPDIVADLAGGVVQEMDAAPSAQKQDRAPSERPEHEFDILERGKQGSGLRFNEQHSPSTTNENFAGLALLSRSTYGTDVTGFDRNIDQNPPSAAISDVAVLPAEVDEAAWHTFVDGLSKEAELSILALDPALTYA